jgi:hypothetical protein
MLNMMGFLWSYVPVQRRFSPSEGASVPSEFSFVSPAGSDAAGMGLDADALGGPRCIS